MRYLLTYFNVLPYITHISKYGEPMYAFEYSHITKVHGRDF